MLKAPGFIERLKREVRKASCKNVCLYSSFVGVIVRSVMLILPLELKALPVYSCAVTSTPASVKIVPALILSLNVTYPSLMVLFANNTSSKIGSTATPLMSTGV